MLLLSFLVNVCTVFLNSHHSTKEAQNLLFPYLFQKFYQVDTAPSSEHGGSGLGLAICKGIIEQHGGKIWLDKTYSNGTAIKFTLPQMT